MLLLGNSGAGKTTLLHLLCGLLTPSSGALTVGSKSLHTSTDRELDRWRGTEVGVIFQQAHFVQSLTMRENLALPHQLTTGRVPEDLEAKMDDMLDRLGIGHRAGGRACRPSWLRGLQGRARWSVGGARPDSRGPSSSARNAPAGR